MKTISSVTSLIILFLFLFLNILPELALAIPKAPEPDRAGKARIVENYGKLPLSFEKNRGQTDKKVGFFSRGGGYTLFLTPDEAVLALRSPLKDKGLDDRRRDASQVSRPEKQKSAKGTVIRMKFSGANTAPVISGQERLQETSNYFIGNDPSKWRTHISKYAKVRYREVYPGIDVVFYGNQRRLEYDFVVSPGSDPSKIKLEFEGVEEVSLDENGNLVLRLKDGEVIQRAPVIYQEVDGKRVDVAGGYRIDNKGRVGCQVASWDRQRPLVIDPVLVYSTYLGGNGFDEGLGIAVDGSGNAYVTGQTSSSDFPKVNALYPNLWGGMDAFIFKLSADGSQALYSTYLGGNSDDKGYGIAVDDSGNAYVTGYTCSSDFPKVNALYPNLWGVMNAFIFKLSADGSQAVYSTYLGGGDDKGYGIAVDISGNVYVTGETMSPDFPMVNALYPNLWGIMDAFIFKLSADGSHAVYSTYLGGNDFDGGTAIAVDGSGNAYVTGFTESSDFPTVNALCPNLWCGDTNAFIFKLSADGSHAVYSTYLGGSGYDRGHAIAVDSHENAVYVTGNTSSSDFPTVNALYPNLWGDSDAFIFKLSDLQYFFPVISQVPNSGPPGTTFTVWGTDFTPNGTASLFMHCPNNPIRQIPLDNEGHFEITFTVPLDHYAPAPCGCWAIDDYTGSYSNETFYEITEALIYEPQHQLEYCDLPAKTPTAKNLVFITHGWMGNNATWVTDIKNSIIHRTESDGRINPDEWDVWAYDWSDEANTGINPLVGPPLAFVNAISLGECIGKKLATFNYNYDHIHFIAHSAGSELIDTAANWIKALDGDSPPTIHCTFLDAYDPRGDLSTYGASATWAEQYVDMRPLTWNNDDTWDTTDTFYRNAFNFNVTYADPEYASILDWTRKHAWPYMFYQKTIDDDSFSCGFSLSLESGISVSDFMLNILNYPRGGNCTYPICGDISIPDISTHYIWEYNDPLDFYTAQYRNEIITGNSGTVTIDPSIPSQVTLTQGSPVWMSMEFEVIEPINILSLDYEFLSSSDGLLSVFFDNKVVSKIDERVAFEGTNKANSIWLGEVEPGTHVLSFRLDSFTGGQSVVKITNVRTGVMKVITSVPGDLDGDGNIDTTDFSFFRSTLGKCTGDAGFVAEADYDDDGCVTYADYRIWYGYYRNQ